MDPHTGMASASALGPINTIPGHTAGYGSQLNSILLARPSYLPVLIRLLPKTLHAKDFDLRNCQLPWSQKPSRAWLPRPPLCPSGCLLGAEVQYRAICCVTPGEPVASLDLAVR